MTSLPGASCTLEPIPLPGDSDCLHKSSRMCMWLSWEGAGLSCTIPWVQSPVPQKTSVEMHPVNPALGRCIQEDQVILSYIGSEATLGYKRLYLKSVPCDT